MAQPSPAAVAKPLTELAVTYAMVAPDDSYIRCAKLATPAYIWGKKDDSEPITEVKILFDNEPADDFVKIPEDLNKGKSVFLCYKKGGSTGSPLLDVKVFTDEDPVQEGFVKIDKDITRGETLKAYVYIKTKASGEKKAKEFAVGDFIDVVDTVNKWCVGRVVDKNDKGEILIHYEGWSDKWNEWMPKTSKRLAVYRTHTRGKDTGPEGNDKAFQFNQENLEQFKALAPRLDTLAEKKEFTEDERTFLVVDSVKWVQNVLNAVVDDPEVLPHVTNYLRKVLSILSVLIRSNQDIPDVLFESLVRIFDGDVRCKRFYNKYGLAIPKDKSADKDGVYAKRPQRDPAGKELTVSIYLLDMINSFGEMGGFQAMAERLSDPNRTTSFHAVRMFVRALFCIRDHLTSSFLRDYIAKLVGTVFDRIRQITDEELKTLDRDALVDLVKHMEILMILGSQPALTVSEFIEKINLDICLRLITCKLLEKRINGVAELNAAIERVRRKEAPVSNVYGYQVRQGEVAKFLTSEFMVRWISENKVLDILLGPSSHHELLKRTPAILKFLASNNALTGELLDLLWSSGQGKHETVVRVVYDCVADLAQELSLKHLDLLFARVTEIPPSEYRDTLLLFVRSFTVNAVVRNPNVKAQAVGARKWYGVELFWKLIQDSTSSEVPTEVAELALTTLIELLSSYEFEPLKLQYIEKCVINLKESTSVMQALRVCKKIIETYPTGLKHSGYLSVESLLLQLETKMGLTGLIIQDFRNYNQQALKVQASRSDGPEFPSASPIPSPRPSSSLALDEKKAEPPTPKSSGRPVEQNVFVGRYTHAQQIDSRLEFLDYVLAHSNVTITREHIDVLWDAMVSNAVAPIDRNKLLSWLNDARESNLPREVPILSDDVTAYIFTGLLCNPQRMDYAAITKKGYKCFQTYLCVANQPSGALEAPTRLNPRRRLMVTKFSKLVGLDSLWTIAASAIDPDVSAAAGNFLIALYVRTENNEKKRDIYKAFVEKSMKLLQESSAAINANENAESSRRLVLQVVSLLENFLFQIEQNFNADDDEALMAPAQAAASRQSNQNMQLLVTVKDRDNPVSTRMTVTISLDSKIGAMRKELARHIKHPPELIQFLYKERVLYPEEYDDMTIADARITKQKDSILAIKMGPEDVLSRPADDAKQAQQLPRVMLSNEKQYFDLLFELLKIGGRVGQGVWRLLTRLPINSELSNNIRKLALRDSSGTPEWSKLIDASSILRLFYALQIIDKVVQTKETDSEIQKQDVATWCGAFLTQGGLRHLYSVIVDLPLDEVFADSLPQQCLTFLIRLFNFFMQGRYASIADKVADNAVDFRVLIGQLVNLVGRVVRAGAAAVDANAETIRTGGEGALDSVGDVQAAALVQVMRALTHSLCYRPKLLPAFYEHPNVDQILFSALTAAVPRIREISQQELTRLCVQFDSVAEDVVKPRQWLLPQLLSSLPKINTRSTNCNEYFELISQLVAATRAGDGGFNSSALSKDLSTKIVQHPVVEARAADNDSVLRGLLTLTRELIHADPSLKEPLGQQFGLVNDLFQNCLFAVPIARKRGVVPPPKCKSKASRKAAFSLLLELAKGCDANFRALVRLVTPNHFVTHSNGQRPFEWDFEAKYEEKSETGYAGLKNLGCICYMNSLMQQLFMIPKLRQNVLTVEETDKDALANPNDSFMFQLQYIFSFLQESDKQYCDPTGFCQAFKDWEGNPTNIHVQMDAQEFLNMLFDRIDTKVKGSPYENCLKSVLGGVYSNELICKGCPHYKERPEDFYAISINVKNKKTLYESLQSFVEGEMLEGDNAYLCGKCNKKVDTLKRTCLKELPSTVIFHLKRFEFDFDKMQKVKLNDRFEFPRHLNLKPFTKEALSSGVQGQSMDGDDGKDDDGKAEVLDRPEEYYEYELSGVLVHTGSADRGHYYSFVRERLTEEERVTGQEPRWFEFNDTLVRLFDPQHLEEECFGGEEARPRSYYGMGMGPEAMSTRSNQYSATGAGTTGGTTMMEKYRNAYLLVYDRVQPKLQPTVAVSIPLPQPTQAPALAVPFLNTSDNEMNSAGEIVSRVTVPSGINKQIWEQNITYWRDRAVFDPDYFEFVWELVSAATFVPNKEFRRPAPDDLEPAVTQLATRFVFETLSRSARKEHLQSFFQLLRKLYSLSVPSCIWLLETISSETGWSYDFLFSCPHAEVRKSVSNLFCLAISEVASFELQYFPKFEVAQKRLSEDNKEQDTPLPLVMRYTDSLCRLLREAPENWKRFDHYFRVLAYVAQLDTRAAHYLLAKKMIPKVIDLFLGDDSPHPEVGDIPVDSKGKRRRLGDEHGQQADFTQLLVLLSVLVRSARTPAGEPPSLTADSSLSVAELTPLDLKFLLSREFVSRSLVQAFSRKRGSAVGGLFAHLCWENMEATETVMGYISHGIEENGDEEIRPYFRTIMALVAIEDSLVEKRVHCVLSSLLAVMKLQENYWRVTMLCIDHLVRIAKRSPACFQWLNRNGQKLSWMVQFLEYYFKPPAYNDPNMQVFKRDQRSVGYQDHRPPSFGFLGPKQKQQALVAIIEGKQLDTAGASDSDEDLSERVFEVGQWVDVRDTVSKWCEGTVAAVQGDEVKIHYDGWSEKWDEWIDKGSSRIARYGRHSSSIPRERLKGKGPQQGDSLGGGRVFRREDFDGLRANQQIAASVNAASSYTEGREGRYDDGGAGGSAMYGGYGPGLP